MKILFLFLFIASSSFAKDTKYLIQEMEALINGLEANDPSHLNLTLRLADLYFDYSIKENEGIQEEVLRKSRLKALNLYEKRLNSSEKIEAIQRIQIEFQVARLLSRLEEGKRAESYYKNVIGFKGADPQIKKQAALNLGEWFDDTMKYEEAKKYYDIALANCKKTKSCNYIHYRKAWVYYKDAQLPMAISEMKKSLWQSDTEIRETSLKDLTLFLSNSDTDGKEELSYMKGVASKLNRPHLINDLLEAFYVAGNRKAGSLLLGQVNTSSPKLSNEVRLLEEHYGFRDWDKVDEYLAIISKRKSTHIPKDKEEAKNTKKIFRRFIVQVDSESEMAPDLRPYLKRSIISYLNIYPNDDLRKKLQQGLLKVIDNDEEKIIYLTKWIKEDTDFGFDPKEIRKLRQTRLSISQKIKKDNFIIEDSLAIAEILNTSDEADEFNYVAGRAYYGSKQFNNAEKKFQDLVSKAIKEKKFSNWSLLSQNLLLDIYNQRKDYQSLIKQVESWKLATADSKDKKILSENKEMGKVLIQARFEYAASSAKNEKSLQEFFDFCFQGIYPEKSCANAKVLAIQFKDQEKLVKLLEKEGDKKSLLVEYELMGRFSDAAKISEETHLKNKNIDYEAYLKTALLYELDQDIKNRTRILGNLLRKIKKEKSIPEKYEGAIYLTIKETDFFNIKNLSLPWTEQTKMKMALALEERKSHPLTKKMILAKRNFQGKIWSKLVLTKLNSYYKKANSIKFYGNRSASLFKRRTNSIDRFVKESNIYLEGGDSLTRIAILDMLKSTYEKMTNDILETPIPEGLDQETLSQVNNQLKTMAEPFQKVGNDYKALLDKQMANIAIESEKKRVSELLANSSKNHLDIIPEKLEPTEIKKVADAEQVNRIKKRLLGEPTNKDALEELKGFYEKQGNDRASIYYTNRIESLLTQEKL